MKVVAPALMLSCFRFFYSAYLKCEHTVSRNWILMPSHTFFFQHTPILAAGETLAIVLFPRSMAQTQEFEETTKDVPMPSINATKLRDKGRWSFSPSNMVVGALLLLTSMDLRSMASPTSAEMAREVPGLTMSIASRIQSDLLWSKVYWHFQTPWGQWHYQGDACFPSFMRNYFLACRNSDAKVATTV